MSDSNTETKPDEGQSGSTAGLERCEYCRFASPVRNYRVHDCLRHAPKSDKLDNWQDGRVWVPRWPIVRSDDWCGDFERSNGQS